jgi:hypothetical protein
LETFLNNLNYFGQISRGLNSAGLGAIGHDGGVGRQLLVFVVQRRLHFHGAAGPAFFHQSRLLVNAVSQLRDLFAFVPVYESALIVPFFFGHDWLSSVFWFGCANSSHFSQFNFCLLFGHKQQFL